MRSKLSGEFTALRQMPLNAARYSACRPAENSKYARRSDAVQIMAYMVMHCAVFIKAASEKAAFTAGDAIWRSDS